MKKLLVLLAAVLAFTCTSVAQYGSSSSSSGQTSEQTSTKSKSKKSSDQTGEKATKQSTITGCLSKEPDASGNYTFTNGKYKKGVQVGPADKLQGHGGHTVQLTGSWSGKNMFEVSSMKHISPTCESAAGGTTKKGKMSTGGDMSEKPPKQ